MGAVKEKKKIPELRFYAFNSDWKESTLNKVGDIVGGGTPSTSNKEFWGGDINWFTPTEIKNKYIDESIRKITKSGLENSSAKILPKGTVLLSTRATVGEASIAKEVCSTNQGFQSIIVNENNDNNFVYYWILRNKKEFLRKSNGSTFLEVSGKEVKKIKGFFPSKEEQQKIANFLSSVDAYIENLKTQKEKLEEYKRGMMQNIFSQEIRFKDEEGNEFPEWEEKVFSDIYCFYRNNSLSRANLQEDGDIANIHYGDIHTGYASHIDIGKKDFSYIAGDKIEGDLVEVGDIVIADASEDRFDVGKTVEILGLGNKKVVSGLHTFLARPKGLSLGFSGYLMRSEKVRRQLWKIATGASVLGISKKELSKIQISFPGSLDEQKKIVNFLTSIDEMLEINRRNTEEATKWKSGLLQKMFV